MSPSRVVPVSERFTENPGGLHRRVTALFLMTIY